MLWSKMRMDINQIIELWRGLSPHLTGAGPGKDIPNDELAGEIEREKVNKNEMATPIGDFDEENNV